MLPAHDVLASPTARPGWGVVFVHGILGSRNNWRSFARKVLEHDPRWSAVLVDLRNHGESHGFSPPHTLEACAEDIEALITSLALDHVVLVGHSYGGKVMLEVARRGVITAEAAWIMDAPAGVRDLGSGLEEIERVIAAVRAVPVPIATRRDLVERLTASGLSDRLAQWMTTNLRNGPDGALEWKFALDTIPAMLASFGATDYWPYLESHRDRPRIHLVRGGRSDRWSAEELARTSAAHDAGLVQAHLLPDAGHWLHTDDPDTLLAMFLPALPD